MEKVKVIVVTVVAFSIVFGIVCFYLSTWLQKLNDQEVERQERRKLEADNMLAANKIHSDSADEADNVWGNTDEDL